MLHQILNFCALWFSACAILVLGMAMGYRFGWQDAVKGKK